MFIYNLDKVFNLKMCFDSLQLFLSVEGCKGILKNKGSILKAALMNLGFYILKLFEMYY